MWVEGSPANAFDPDLCHSPAKIREHWQSYNAQREDDKCCFTWPALQGSRDADTLSLHSLQEEVNHNPQLFNTRFITFVVILLPLTLPWADKCCVKWNVLMPITCYAVVLFHAVSLSAHHTPNPNAAELALELTVMLNTISHQWGGGGGVKQCCKKAPSSSQSLLPLSPSRAAMTGPGYLIPPQDLLEGMERQQLAAGIRKKGTATDRGHTSLYCMRWRSPLARHSDLQYNITPLHIDTALGRPLRTL